MQHEARVDRPVLRLGSGQGRRLRAGAPWVFSNEIAMRPEYRRLPPGGLVCLEGDDGGHFGTFMFNPHSLIAARLLDRDPDAVIGVDWLRARLAAAIALRERVCDGPFHRLVHAEADRLPGLVIDRYDDVAVLAANTAGMELLTPLIVEALRALLPLRAIVGRNDWPRASWRGCRRVSRCCTVPMRARWWWRAACGSRSIYWRGRRPAGSSTSGAIGIGSPGWFGLAPVRRAEFGCWTCSVTLALSACVVPPPERSSVLLADASAPALELALQAAALNGVAERVTTRRGDAFETMTALAAEGQRFDVVICDPPAFARSRKDAEAGLRAYGRMARLAAALVAPGGFLFVASCSYHAPLDAWTAQIAFGLHRARREARILCTSGAGPDHPVHPQLPESAYLKAQLLQLF